MQRFELDPRLEADSESVMICGLCELRLSRDARWPWLLMVPRRPDIVELFDLTPLDQVLLTFECEMVARALKEVTGAHKINIGALGNIVRQMHVHIVARFEGDSHWPGPVWGYGQATAYDEQDKKDLIASLREALSR